MTLELIVGSSGIGPSLPTSGIATAVKNGIVGFRMTDGLYTQARVSSAWSSVKYYHVNFTFCPTDNPTSVANTIVSYLKSNSGITSIGGPNEPNCGAPGKPCNTTPCYFTPQQYAPFAIAIYKAMKSAGRPELFAPGELSGNMGSGPQSWASGLVTACASLGTPEPWDMFCFHLYPGPTDDFNSIASNIASAYNIVKAPLIIGEMNIGGGSGAWSGTANPSGLSQDQATQLLAKTVASNPNVAAIYYYGWYSSPWKIGISGSSLNNWGTDYYNGCKSSGRVLAGGGSTSKGTTSLSLSASISQLL